MSSSDLNLPDLTNVPSQPGKAVGAPVHHDDMREKTAAEKASYGMADLRNPALRAQLCATCHVGNAQHELCMSA